MLSHIEKWRQQASTVVIFPGFSNTANLIPKSPNQICSGLSKRPAVRQDPLRGPLGAANPKPDGASFGTYISKGAAALIRILRVG